MNLHDQLKARRRQLGLPQDDVGRRIGMSQQQYQRVEAGGNPRLDTLELIAEGLDTELLLVPRERLDAVRALLREADTEPGATGPASDESDEAPWRGLLD